MRKKPPEFTSRLSRGETLAALLYLPVHIFLLPLVLVPSAAYLGLDATDLNLILYAVGTVYMLLLLFKFLRRDFDPLWEQPGHCVLEIITNYALMYLANLAVTGIFLLLPWFGQENPNNSAVMEMAGQSWGKMSAMAVFLAPIVEECMFRAGIFGTLRRYNREAWHGLKTMIFMGIVAMIAGGIGIMNVTMAIIFSRTKEIGIRRALGASRRDILFQFITEALLLGLCGAILGMAIGYISLLYMAEGTGQMTFSWWVVAASILIALTTSFFFALYPAYQAALLKPVNALKYE